MKAYRITLCRFISDLSGFGASLNGGRWNSEGMYGLYVASTASLALLETLAHIKVLPQAGFCIACIHIPDDTIQLVDEDLLPHDWRLFPAPHALQELGDTFLKEQKYLGLQLPSALLPEDKVILLNPKHPQFKKVNIEYSRPLDIDNRLYNK
jgi:RES domain-containing protein